MSFFDSFPKPPPPEPRRHERPAWAQPEAAIPGSVPLEFILVRTDQVAVAIGSVRAYPNGFEFTVHARLRAAADDFGRDPFASPAGDNRARTTCCASACSTPTAAAPRRQARTRSSATRTAISSA